MLIVYKEYAQEMKRKIKQMADELQQKDKEMERMTYKLQQKEEETERLKQVIANLEDSKRKLAINSNKCLNDMREYLLIYQNAVFRTN